MAIKVILPKQGLQMTEGIIARWLVQEGQRVEADAPLFEMETDKLNIEINSPAAGTLLKIIRGEGETVPVAETIAVIGEPGEDISRLLDAVPGAADEETAANSPPEGRGVAAAATEPAKKPDGRFLITPRAKTRAIERSIDFSAITGTGPDGLVIERDILAWKPREQPATTAAPPAAAENGRLIPLAGMRKVIADRMMQSLQGMAQANHRMKVDMGEVVRFRDKLKDGGVKVSFTDILVMVVGRALVDFPIVNSSLTDEGILLKADVNIGIAVAVENGLLVPVIRHADRLTLPEIAALSAELSEKARQGRLLPDEYSGGSFTITNLGMFDIDEFTAIINPPESAILAIGKIARVPVAEGDEIVIRPVMTMCLTYDHRIIDGAPAAQFLQRIKQILQNPYLLI